MRGVTVRVVLRRGLLAAGRCPAITALEITTAGGMLLAGLRRRRAVRWCSSAYLRDRDRCSRSRTCRSHRSRRSGSSASRSCSSSWSSSCRRNRNRARRATHSVDHDADDPAPHGGNLVDGTLVGVQPAALRQTDGDQHAVDAGGPRPAGSVTANSGEASTSTKSYIDRSSASSPRKPGRAEQLVKVVGPGTAGEHVKVRSRGVLDGLRTAGSRPRSPGPRPRSAETPNTRWILGFEAGSRSAAHACP